MIPGKHAIANKILSSRRGRSRCAILALAAVALFAGTACDEEATGRAFRDAASSNLESGVKSIMDGIIEGMFAAFELGTDQTSDAGGAGTTTGTGS